MLVFFCGRRENRAYGQIVSRERDYQALCFQRARAVLYFQGLKYDPLGLSTEAFVSEHGSEVGLSV